MECPDCGESGEVVLAASTEASIGTVGVLLERRPTVACPSQHGLSPPESVRSAMAATEAALVRAKARLLRRGDRCASCGAPLTMPVRRTKRTVTVEASGEVPVLTLHFDLPATRCPSCGVDQLPTRSQEDLVVSVPAVFDPRRASTSPSG